MAEIGSQVERLGDTLVVNLEDILTAGNINRVEVNIGRKRLTIIYNEENGHWVATNQSVGG